MFNKTKTKSAFTLAEVLITLVIIGVVAALTIPAAINKYKDEKLKSQFKKAYSTIAQAVQKTEMNDFYGRAYCFFIFPSEISGSPNIHDVTTIYNDCFSFYDALAKNLRVEKVCRGNSKSEGCVPEYQTYNPHEVCRQNGQNWVDNYNYSYVLSDGTILNVYFEPIPRIYPMFLVDINGHKGPNAYGKDLFNFIIKMDSSTKNVYISPDTFPSCEFPVSGGRKTKEMMQYALAGKK